MDTRIRTCTPDDIAALAETISNAFRNIAERFGLTEENAPRHPSNCTEDWIQKDMARGVTYFMLENENLVAGCVALEQADAAFCYMERLCVLPQYRHLGFGRMLVAKVFSEAEALGVRQVNIGIIAEHKELKDWYRTLGFVEGESKTFPHLHFRVTFMTYDVRVDR